MTIKPSQTALLTEYQSAQSSAEHHDRLVWTVTHILWALSIAIFGFILTKMGHSELRILLTSLAFIGIMLLSYSWFCALQFSFIRNQKYKRCKEIEALLGLKQHTDLQHPHYFQRVLYALLFWFIIVAWIVLIVHIWLL
jgi:hypothetical protein